MKHLHKNRRHKVKYTLKNLIGLLVLPLLIATVSGQVFAFEITEVKILDDQFQEPGTIEAGDHITVAIKIGVNFGEGISTSKAKVAVRQRYQNSDDRQCGNEWGENQCIRDKMSWCITDLKLDGVSVF